VKKERKIYFLEDPILDKAALREEDPAFDRVKTDGISSNLSLNHGLA
jgi:hypothetical protein